MLQAAHCLAWYDIVGSQRIVALSRTAVLGVVPVVDTFNIRLSRVHAGHHHHHVTH
jgi:hypothetical protein